MKNVKNVFFMFVGAIGRGLCLDAMKTKTR
jgi:hypothetical protein